jgi:hypothetical protein
MEHEPAAIPISRIRRLFLGVTRLMLAQHLD